MDNKETNDRMVTASELERSIPIIDFCAAYRIPFLRQRGVNRYYRYTNADTGEVTDFTVNVNRNQWISRDNSLTGTLTELHKILGMQQKGFDGNYKEVFKDIMAYYRIQVLTPSHYPTAKVRLGTDDALIGALDSKNLHSEMCRRGISIATATLYCQEIHKKERNKEMESKYLAFPCENGFYCFNGVGFRPLGDPGISTIGEFRQDQNCYVYENAMDFLALMELWGRNRVESLFANEFHLILNGSQNLKEAADFIKLNPDFRQVKTLFPNNNEGAVMTSKIFDITKGTSKNCSSLFEGFESLGERLKQPVPLQYATVIKCMLKGMKADEIQAILAKQGMKSQKPAVKPEELLGNKTALTLGSDKAGLKL